MEFPAPPWAVLLPALLFAWPFAGYPALMLLLARLRKPVAPPPDPPEWPELALIICALNEARVIGAKIENSLALDYPAGRLKIVAVNDGSTDETAAIIRRYAERGIEIVDRPQRRGKVTNLNEVIAARPEPFIVLSDANVMYHPLALKRLMRRFSDPQVGCVSGKVALVNTTRDLNEGEGAYYSLEWMLQEQASRLWSMAGADGAMHAFRRELYRPSPPDTLIEDLVMPLQIVNQGYRVVMEPEARAVEQGPATPEEEFRRKVRIAAGAAQALLRGNGVPGGRAPARFWFIWVSHKLLRWFSPLLGLATLAAAALTAANPWSKAILAAGSLLGALAALRWATGWDSRPLNACFYFLFGQAAILRGLWRGATGRQSVLWAKANR